MNTWKKKSEKNLKINQPKIFDQVQKKHTCANACLKAQYDFLVGSENRPTKPLRK